MEFYAALVLALTLAAVAAVLYFYTMFLESRARQMKRHIAELERAGEELSKELRQTKMLLERQLEHERELWPDVLGEGGDLPRN